MTGAQRNGCWRLTTVEVHGSEVHFLILAGLDAATEGPGCAEARPVVSADHRGQINACSDLRRLEALEVRDPGEPARRQARCHLSLAEMKKTVCFLWPDVIPEELDCRLRACSRNPGGVSTLLLARPRGQGAGGRGRRPGCTLLSLRDARWIRRTLPRCQGRCCLAVGETVILLTLSSHPHRNTY